MRQSSVSMLVFAVYMGLLSVILVFLPHQFCAFFGVSGAGDPWIRLFGVVLGILAYYYVAAIGEGARNFFRWTVYGRFVLLPAILVMVVFGIAPPIFLLFGTWDSGCAVWTGLALRREGAWKAQARTAAGVSPAA